MNIYPSIDILGGKCVRLLKGRFDQVTHYPRAPIEFAQAYADAGAKHLHIVDLSGAEASENRQFDLIKTIVEDSPLEVQVGGGIRCQAEVERLLELGVKRVVIGSLAVKDEPATRAIFEALGGDRITLAADVQWKDDAFRVATEGWTQTENITGFELIQRYQSAGLQHVLCTDIQKDGTLEGPNVALYQKLVQSYPGLQVQASGGVQGLSDLPKLRETGAHGVIIGKALLEQRFTLEEALRC